MNRTTMRRAVMTGVVTGVVATMFALAGCGTGNDHGSMPGMGSATTTTGGSPGAAGFNDADVVFAQMMIPHHRQAVDMATLADTRASDQEVKQLARQIKAAQDPEINTMTGWLATWGRPTTVPSGMPGMDMGQGGMPGMMSDADMTGLKAVSGKNFDKQFLTMMIAHHQGAIQMARQEQTSGVNADAKALAERIATSQQGEIDTMNKIIARL
jgi:uncharacterized protein (DUF305 family)